MMRFAIAILGAAALAVSPALGDDQGPKTPGAGTGAEAKAKANANAKSKADSSVPEADERAIRAAAEAFARAYNAGDARSLAEQFAEDAEVVDREGDQIRGRAAIEELLTASFQDEPGLQIAMTIDSLRSVSPDVIEEEGRNTITSPGNAPLIRRHLVLHVKRDGRWLISSVRDEKELPVRPHDRLKVLEWMLGEWTDEGADAVVRTDCYWSKDKSYLMRSIQVRVRGETAMSITQRIGWDPLTRQIKSWEFDSEGGYSEGLWSRDGANWVVKHKGVLPDGRTTSATRLIALETPGRVRWVSLDRVAGGEAIPEEMAYTMVKVPPAAMLREGANDERGPSASPESAPSRDK